MRLQHTCRSRSCNQRFCVGNYCPILYRRSYLQTFLHRLTDEFNPSSWRILFASCQQTYRLNVERLLHLDVECVARFAFVRGNWSKRIFAIKHTDFYPCTFAETGQRPCSYLYRNMQPHRVSNRLKTSLCGNKSKIPSSQLSCCWNRYLPFPCPVTGSIIPRSAISRSSAELLVGFKPSTRSTSDLPNIDSLPKTSCNLRTFKAVFDVKASSMFTFSSPMFAFFMVNVRFSLLFERTTDMQCPIMKWMILVQQEILEKQLKEFRRLMNAIFQVIIICSDKCIPKIPCMLSKNVVCHIKTQRT